MMVAWGHGGMKHDARDTTLGAKRAHTKVKRMRTRRSRSTSRVRAVETFEQEDVSEKR